MKKCILVVALSLSALFMHAQVDTTRVLCVGNSFTYYFDSHLKLAEIALSQGHYIDMTAAYVGGYTFNMHLNDLKTISAIEQFTSPYDCVFLQNQLRICIYAIRPQSAYEKAQVSGSAADSHSLPVADYYPADFILKQVLPVIISVSKYTVFGIGPLYQFIYSLRNRLEQSFVKSTLMLRQNALPVLQAIVCAFRRKKLVLFLYTSQKFGDFIGMN